MDRSHKSVTCRLHHVFSVTFTVVTSLGTDCFSEVKNGKVSKELLDHSPVLPQFPYDKNYLKLGS